MELKGSKDIANMLQESERGIRQNIFKQQIIKNFIISSKYLLIIDWLYTGLIFNDTPKKKNNLALTVKHLYT